MSTLQHGNWRFNLAAKNTFVTDENVITDRYFQTNSLSSAEPHIIDLRKAAIIHKVVREHARSMLKDGLLIKDLVDMVEQKILALTKQDSKGYYKNGGSSGIAFPVGVNVNNIVAHDSKLSNNDDRKLYRGDVVKLDIGVHVNGMIIDSAFTHIVTKTAGVHDNDNVYNAVLDASRDAMFSAIALSGPDQPLYELSEYIDEIISSYEVDLNGDTLPITSVKGIGGHNLNRYSVHDGKLVLSCPNHELQDEKRMLDGELYAIETFATTGSGNMTQHDQGNISHFIGTTSEKNKSESRAFKKSDLYKWMSTRNGLPFSYDWTTNLSRLKKSYKSGLESGLLVAYPPLYDMNDAVVAQFEHTIQVKDGGVEIFSLGTDY